MGILSWIIVGLIAGFLAGQVIHGGGYGVLVVESVTEGTNKEQLLPIGRQKIESLKRS